jgi:hypothetical protein
LINLTFEGDPLYETCSDLGKAEQAYGSISAGALVAFISEAASFETVDELIDFLGNDVNILPDDSLSVAIGSEYQATLIVVGKRYTRNGAGRVIWSSVTRLKVLDISRVP